MVTPAGKESEVGCGGSVGSRVLLAPPSTTSPVALSLSLDVCACIWAVDDTMAGGGAPLCCTYACVVVYVCATTVLVLCFFSVFSMYTCVVVLSS